MNKYRLMVPGPTPLPPEVAAAAVLPIEDERTSRYAAVFTRVLGNIQRALLTRNDVLLFTASMTGAFEGTLQNLFSPGDRVLVISNGAFGQRWAEMARAFGLDVVVVCAEWGRPVSAHRIAQAVADTPGLLAAIAVHSETSTGVVNDIRGFCAATRGVVSIVDSASGAGACELRTDEWGADVVVAGSQKALMTPPGLAFASVSPRAWRLHERATLARYYFDWDQARDALRAAVPRTPWTPGISLISQLDVALRRLHDEGIENVFRRHIALGRIARAGVRGMGLRLFSPDDDRSASVTAAALPATVNGGRLVDHLLDRYGIQLAGGQDSLAGRIIRIGHCGYVDPFDVLTALSALELALCDLGHPVELGSGVSAALRVVAGHHASHANGSSATRPVPVGAFQPAGEVLTL